MLPALLDAYRFRRRNCGYAATDALRLARKDVAANLSRYPRASFGMRGGANFAIGRDTVFWCECPDDYLRRVGYVDEIQRELGYSRRDIHEGWYMSDDNISGEVARGVVYRLPARDGKERFMYGVADPNQNGPVMLCVDIVDDKADAARYADHIAERYAENERDYQRAWQAGREHEELGDQIAAQRKATLALIREVKANCAKLSDMPRVRDIIRAAIEDYQSETEEARERRAELFEQFGNELGFVE